MRSWPLFRRSNKVGDSPARAATQALRPSGVDLSPILGRQHTTDPRTKVVYCETLSNPTLVEPNEIYRYEIPIGPVGVKLDTGERIRVQVTSNDFPQWDRNLNTGGPLFCEGASAAIVAQQTVLHDAGHASYVTLPVMRASS